MSICYHEGSREFHLSNRDISYIITVLKNGQLGQLYFGKKLHDRESFAHLLELRHRPMAVCTYEGDSTFSMEHIKQEYPSYGAGDMAVSGGGDSAGKRKPDHGFCVSDTSDL